MAKQDRYDVMEPADPVTFPDGSSARPLVVGTVPRDRKPSLYMAARSGPIPEYNALYGAGGGSTGAGIPIGSTTKPAGDPIEKANFPFEMTAADLKRGQERYAVYCSMCHGQTGEGNGMIVQRGFTRPPSYFPLASDKTMFPDLYTREQSLLNQPAGHFYYVITNGWGAMYSYGERVTPDDRWRIAAYIKALQMSRSVKLADLSADDQAKVNMQASTATIDSARDLGNVSENPKNSGAPAGGTSGGETGGAMQSEGKVGGNVK